MKLVDKILQESKLEEEIKIPIEVGDTILRGKWRNKKVVVKDIGEDEHGSPTVNGKSILSIRLTDKEEVKEAKLNEKTKEEIKQGHLKNTETGHTIKVSSALSLPKENPARQKAEQMLAQADVAAPQPPQEGDVAVEEPKTTPSGKKSHKPKARSFGINKDAVQLIASKGIPKLSVYPQSFVKISDIQFNPALSKDNYNKIWICKFPSVDKNGKTVIKTAYTQEFLVNNQKNKYKKISKIKEKDIQSIGERSGKLLKAKDRRIADSAAIIRIIASTGLRPGSEDDDKEGGTGNLGVRTLKVGNVKVNKESVTFNFIGKSYQENNAEVKDAALAQYLQNNIKGRKPTERLFNVTYGQLQGVMKKVNPKVNLKDLRTYKATEYAKKLIADTSITGPPPPLPQNPKEIKPLVKEKLKKVFELTAKMLNNEPTMAKTSYVHPIVIVDFLRTLGLEPEQAAYTHPTLKKKRMKKESVDINSEEIDSTDDGVRFTSMDEMFAMYNEEDLMEAVSMDEEDAGLEDVDEFLIPRWFYDDSIDLVKK
jgi:DNA topoisomerase IB